MKLYTCSNCRNLLYFENNVCLNCHHMVGFDAAVPGLITLANEDGRLMDISNKERSYRFCKNAEYGTCNWLVAESDPSLYCRACSLNRIIPSLTTEENLVRWKNIEIAKHRLIYSLLRLELPVSVKNDNEAEGIVFDFMADVAPDKRVVTGHNNGTITLNIEEADETERVRHKEDLGEKYRTLLGHFRHEIGHYYWEVLVKDKPALKKFRKLFGDERKDYTQSLVGYYEAGAPPNWSEQYISPYATAHPWEDWAESWAHYLHMMDTLETAFYFGMRINPAEVFHANINKDPYDTSSFSRVIKWWLPLSLAMNSLNRSMGHPDFYPFVISAPAADKLKFIHDLLFHAKAQKERKVAD